MTAGSHKLEGVKFWKNPLTSKTGCPFIFTASLHKSFSGKTVFLTDIGAGNVPARVEIDPDELSLRKRTRQPLVSDRCGPQTSFRLTNLEELSFLTVFALPKASRIGLAFNSCCSNSP